MSSDISLANALWSNKSCAHCNKSFSKTLHKAKKFLVDAETRRPKTVSVREGIKTVFEFKYGSSIEEDYNMLQEDLALCTNCTLTLAKLVVSIELFQKAGVAHSYTTRMSKGMQKLLIKANLPPPSPKESKKVNQNANDNNLEERENDYSGGDNDGVDFQNESNDDSVDDDGGDEPKKKNKRKIYSPNVGVLYSNSYLPENPDDIKLQENTIIDFKRRKIGGEGKPFQCHLCSSGFDKQTNLTRHLLLSHEIGDREKTFKCHCGKAFYFAYQYNIHVRIHGTERPFVCDFGDCKMSFKNKLGLHHHKQVVHRPDRPFKCLFCPKTFKDARNHRVHENYIHKVPKGHKTYPCRFGCGQMYRWRHSANTHHRKCSLNPNKKGDSVEEDQNKEQNEQEQAEKQVNVETNQKSENSKRTEKSSTSNYVPPVIANQPPPPTRNPPLPIDLTQFQILPNVNQPFYNNAVNLFTFKYA